MSHVHPYSLRREENFLEASISLNEHNPTFHIFFHSWFLFHALLHVVTVSAICCSLYISFRFKCSTPLCFSFQKYKKEFFVEVMIIKWKFIHPRFARHFLFLIAFFLSFSALECVRVLLHNWKHTEYDLTQCEMFVITYIYR
jgi:hypothetical protein